MSFFDNKHRFIRILLTILYAYSMVEVEGVDRSNFKTCEQSSFCKRQREYKEDSNRYILNEKSIRYRNNDVVIDFLRSTNIDEYFLQLSFLKSGSIRFFINNKDASDAESRFQIPDGDVLLPQSTLKPNFEKSKDSITCKASNEVSVKLFFKPFKALVYKREQLISVINKNDFMNIEEKPVVEDQVSKNETENANTEGFSETFKSHKDTRPKGPSSVGLHVEFTDVEYAYGLPEHADTFALKNTKDTDPYRLYNLDVFEYELYNPMALYGSVPMVFLKGINRTCGMYWNNPSETWVDIKSSRKTGEGLFSGLFSSNEDKKYVDIHWMSESGVIDFFIFTGETNQEISRQYTSLTGTTPLPPLFAIAYHQCRWNYNNEEDIISLNTNFDQYNIPVDVLWLDIEHTDGKRYFTWDKSKFPDPGKMVDELMLKERRLVTVIDPHIKSDSNYALYNQAKEKGLLIKDASGKEYSGWCWPGSSAYPDFCDAKVRQWWSDQFLTYEPVRNNTMFSWNDMGEPSVFSGPEVTMHKDALHLSGYEHRDVHNLYGMYVHIATFDGQMLRSGNQKRPFVLTRAFFAGSQRTAAVWTGDNAAKWEHLQISMPMLLSLSIAGISFCGADVGGFFGNPDEELLVRWYQAGAYQPFFRAHAHLDTARREPWLYPEATTNLIRDAILHRYALLPYWYTEFARGQHSGRPVMIPLWYEFDKQPELLAVENTYMVGESILVSPVTSAGATYHEVTLPNGPTWYQYPDWQMYKNGKASVPVSLSTIPVFYRSGSIIPRKERIRRSSMLQKNDPYTLYIMAPTEKQNDSVGYLYEDDFVSLNDLRRQLFRMRFTMRPQTKGGHLRFELPKSSESDYIPGCSDDIRGRESTIERLVFIGLPETPAIVQRAMNREPVEQLQFHFTPATRNEASILEVRLPGVNLSDLWHIQLITQAEKHTEL